MTKRTQSKQMYSSLSMPYTKRIRFCNILDCIYEKLRLHFTQLMRYKWWCALSLMGKKPEKWEKITEKKCQQQFRNEDWKVNKLTGIVNNTKHDIANSEMDFVCQATCAIILALCYPLRIMIYIYLDTPLQYIRKWWKI